MLIGIPGFWKAQNKDWKITVFRTSIERLGYQIIYPYLSLYIIALGATKSQLGTITSLGMLMYYEARPCGMSGLFDTDMPWKARKSYYSFKMFNELYKLDNTVAVENDANLLSAAAVGENKAAFVFTHFCDDDTTSAETVKVDFNGFSGENGVKATYYLLDANKDLELVREEVFCGENYSTVLNAELYSSYLVILEKV